MGYYHAEIINLSLQNEKLLLRLPIVSLKKRFLGYVKIYTVCIAEDALEEAVKSFQSNMSTKLNKEWYLTFHNAEHIIVVFREKVFRLSGKGVVAAYQKTPDISRAQDKAQWEELLEYARVLGIPQDQCDFLPEDFSRRDYESSYAK